MFFTRKIPSIDMSCSVVSWLVLIWSRYRFYTVSLENHWHKTPVAGSSPVSSCCCDRWSLPFSQGTWSLPSGFWGSGYSWGWCNSLYVLLFKTLKCGAIFVSTSRNTFLYCELDGWILFVKVIMQVLRGCSPCSQIAKHIWLWTLIWLVA